MAVTETVSPARITTPPPVDERAAAATWYKDAVIYQLHIKSFFDSDGDGVGDFRGLTQKLDYIQNLGVTAIWLLPFYPSPLKDDGYDIADYTRVNPLYGTLRDFKRFLKAAHDRGLRVITELVMNHTSDQHEWFQRSRRSKPGSKWRDFYVWSDTPEKYADTRIIFQDFEASNWTWDAVAGAYFWHRFYSHQPDLNFDNPDVRQAMFDSLDFWLDMGVDGMRLDAVPYLYEREGTTCENLPETHQFLKDLRKHVDEKYEGRMLLAEANQWPEDAAAYFGDGDECHMNFHFPLMPRLFMAIQREDRFPIIDILQQTPEISETSQWAIFLRNHDELTLEMVTDEERDYMYHAYAEDPQARINLGIRRRLAPLLHDNRRKMELMNGLLFSLPGTPIVYYGDEIAMGDNIYVGDRDGVRTPMQWTPDRNAGFSAANPQKLFLPVIINSEYHYATRNVEIEENSRHSMLWWTRRLIGLRKKFAAFGRGTLRFLTPENAKVLVYVRQHDDESILVVANLSRFVQAVTMDLSDFRGMIPVEIFGQTRLPIVEDSPYTVTLGPYSFYWLKLEWPREEAISTDPEKLPVLSVRNRWEEIFSGKCRGRLQTLLPRYLKGRRWFAGKARTVQNAEIIETVPLPADSSAEGIRVVLVRVEYTEGDPDTYLLPLACASGAEVDEILGTQPEKAIARVKTRGDETAGLLYEAVAESAFWNRLLQSIARRRSMKGEQAALTSLQTKAFRRLNGAPLPADPHVHGGEQSNTSAIFGDRFIFKLFRRISPGVNPDLEIGRFLTEHSPLEHVPQVAGAIEYRINGREPMTVAVLHEFQPNEGDAWKYTLDELSRYGEHVLTQHEHELPETQDLPTGVSLVELADRELSPLAHEMIGGYLGSAELLGKRTAELHLALASKDNDPAFAPEAFTPFYQRGLYESMRKEAKLTFQLLRRRIGSLPEPLQEDSKNVLSLESTVNDRYRALTAGKITGLRTRCHGDYHLGQVLFTGRDFVIIDFEGEPSRPLSERRIKTSPLRDVAGMLRSFHYASHAASRGQAPGLMIPDESQSRAETWLHFWYIWCATAFLKSYLQTAETGNFLPKSREQLHTVLNAYVLHKLFYELGYELNNRPDWVGIPLSGILHLSETEV